jgi:hypothetical protein
LKASSANAITAEPRSMMLAAFVGAARKHVVFAAMVDHAFVLDHAALGEDDQLAAVQQFARQERKQVGQIVRDDTDRIEELAETFVAFEKLRRRDRAAIGAGCFVDQVLGNKGFKAREMVEQENIALVYGIVIAIAVLVQLDVEFEQFAGSAKRLNAKVIDPGIDIVQKFRKRPIKSW